MSSESFIWQAQRSQAKERGSARHPKQKKSNAALSYLGRNPRAGTVAASGRCLRSLANQMAFGVPHTYHALRGKALSGYSQHTDRGQPVGNTPDMRPLRLSAGSRITIPTCAQT